MRHPRHVRQDSGRERELARLAENGEPALQRELHRMAALDYDGSRGFRKAWDRLMVAIFAGR